MIDSTIRRAFCHVLIGLAFMMLGGMPRHAVAHELTTVTIQLKWFHQFQFAGFYAAQKLGYFEDVGLNVVLKAGGPDIDPTEAVMSGAAEFGVGNSTLVIQRSEGKPVVAVAPILQHSPFVILARRDDALATEADLEGRTLMVEKHAAELFAYLKKAGVDLDAITLVPHTGTATSLADTHPSGIDAATAYTSTEPYEAIQADIPFRLFNPRDIGINFYGDTLFTSDAMLADHPEMVRAVRDAVLKGWRYAYDHQDEIISYIFDTYDPVIDRLHMSYEAQIIHDLLISDIIDIGYMSEARWRHIASVFEEVGMIDNAVDFDAFLYEPAEPANPALIRGLIILGLIAILAMLLAQRFYALNASLRREIEQKISLQAELESLATTDSLTGLSNRRKLEEFSDEHIKRARRTKQGLALILFDLDRFKPINDEFGHAAGDKILMGVGAACRSVLRDVDLAARTGGDEFAVLLPDTNAEAAQVVLARLKAAIAAIQVPVSDSETRGIVASYGLDMLTDDDATYDDIAKRADATMYAEKADHKRGASQHSDPRP